MIVKNKQKRGISMMETLLSRNVCMCVILVFGCVGIVGRGIVAGYLKTLIKGTERMGMTRKRALLEIRKRYEDVASLGVELRDFDSFVDKYIDRLRLCAVPVGLWNGFLKNMGVLAAGTGIFSAAYQYYVVGDGAAAAELAMCSAGVCMAMLVVWNQWDVSWHLKTLRDSVKNYLSNSLANRLAREDRRVKAEAASSESVAVTDDSDEAARHVGRAKKKREEAASSYDVLLDRVMQRILVDG